MNYEVATWGAETFLLHNTFLFFLFGKNCQKNESEADICCRLLAPSNATWNHSEKKAHEVEKKREIILNSLPNSFTNKISNIKPMRHFMCWQIFARYHSRYIALQTLFCATNIFFSHLLTFSRVSHGWCERDDVDGDNEVNWGNWMRVSQCLSNLDLPQKENPQLNLK